MALNTSKCNHMTPLRFTGLTDAYTVNDEKTKEITCLHETRS